MEIDGKKEGISERCRGRVGERERRRERETEGEGGGKLRGCVALSSAS